jgi:hypothetical protein
MTSGVVDGGRDPDPPLYARALRLRHLQPSGAHCFVLFEVMLVLGALLALAELVPWWGVFALPAAVAAMVKINDVIAGTTARRPGARPGAPTNVRRAQGSVWRGRQRQPDVMGLRRSGGRPVIGRAPVPPSSRPVPPSSRPSAPADESTTLGLVHSLNALPTAEPAGSPQQRARQSASRRYD